MATVRLNHRLRGHILAGIRQLFDVREKEIIYRLETLGVAREALALTYGAKISNLAEALHAESPDWLRTSRSISLVIDVPETDPSSAALTKVTFTETLNSPIPVPEKIAYSWGTRLAMPTTHSQYKRCLELAKEVVHIASERKTLVDAVGKILEESTTLQQAHARWGSVLDYVSSETRTEFYAKAPPRARKSSLPEETRKSSLPEEAQVVLMKARMLQR